MLDVLSFPVVVAKCARDVGWILEQVCEWEARTGLRLTRLLAGRNRAGPLKGHGFGEAFKIIERLPFALQARELCIRPPVMLQGLPGCFERDVGTGKSHE